MSTSRQVTAIIAAGGRGQRFGSALPKQLINVAGRPLLERSVSLFLAHPEIDEVIVALPVEIAGDTDFVPRQDVGARHLELLRPIAGLAG